MNYAYSELYLEDAQFQMGAIFDYALRVRGFSFDEFVNIFIDSKEFELLGKGTPHLIAGKSGYEVANQILDKVIDDNQRLKYNGLEMYPPYFWMGWAIAYYQWHSGHSYKNIVRKISLEDLYAMYETYHTVDITHFVESMDKKYNCDSISTKLKEIREKQGLSQRKLAEISGVKKRLIQLYEQRENDINKGGAYTLYSLATALNVKVEDILEI